MPRITISYRRSDSAGITGRIFDRLAAHYGADSVFMDIDAIPLGVDFRRHIDGALNETDFLLVILGPRWLGPREDGTNRIGDETDPVRIEIETALRIGLRVIPVLVEGATMPAPSALPEALHDFPYLNGTEVSAGKDFGVHVGRLIHFLDTVIGARGTQATPSAATSEPVQPEGSVQPERPAPQPRTQTYRATRTTTALWVAIAIDPILLLFVWRFTSDVFVPFFFQSLLIVLAALFPALVVMLVVAYRVSRPGSANEAQRGS